MNVYDSGRLESLMSQKGWALASGAEEADFIFVNTCSIREKAARRVITHLKTLKPLKKAKPNLIIGVGGCVAEQEGERLLAEVPFLSLVTGPRRLEEIPDLLDIIGPESPPVILSGEASAPAPAAGHTHPAPAEIPIGSPQAPLSAFLTIMEGCDNYCAYCVVPYLRGREKSRPIKEIISEADSLLAKGVREITLLGQNVNSWAGEAENGSKVGLASLLRDLDSLPGLWRLRFTTSHPKDFPPELRSLFGKLPSLCEHLHLPLQSGSDKILSAMGRRYHRKAYMELVRDLREACPDLAISSDIIAGFPGESQADFEDTLSALEEAGFDSIFSFKYSDRPGTRAQSLPGKVSEEEKGRRLALIQERQKSISLSKNQALIGQNLEILAEGPGRLPGQLRGRSRSLKIVNFDGPGHLAGRLAKVRITQAGPVSLKGQLV
jgi:tRNA-2-methylthio-N6-dimethylallyladenosine synthase